MVTTPSSRVRQSVKGNQPFALDRPLLWQVVSGSLGVFVRRIEKAERRYLFTVGPGDLLVGSLADALDLVAIAFEPSEIEPLPWPDSAAGWQRLVPWIQQLSAGPAPLRSTTRTAADQTVTLAPGDRYATAADLVWLTGSQADLRWRGQTLAPGVLPFPLAAAAEVEALATTPLTAATTEALLLERGSDCLRQGLERFQTLALASIDQRWQHQQQQAERRFIDRQRLNQASTRKTLQGLASLLQPETDDYLQAATPLLVVAGAVGHELGVCIKPPPESEQTQRVKEPLESIARASQLRLRQVLLRGKWWTQDGGPLVAYGQGPAEDRQPVALLPVQGNQYRLLRASGETLPVTAAVARTLDPVAFMFYRPLPGANLNAWELLRFAFYGRRRDLWTLGLTGVAATLLGMVVPQMTAVLVDDAIPFGSTSLLIQIGLTLIAVTLGRTSFRLVQAIAAMRLETSSDAVLQGAVWDRLLKLNTGFFRDYATGDLLSRVSSITAIRRKLSGSALDAILSGSFALLNLGLLFYYSAQLALLAVAVALVVMVVTVGSGLLLLKKQRPLLELSGEIYGLMVQLINGVSKLRLAAAEARAFAQWGEKYRQLLRLELSTQRIEDFLSLFNTVMPTLTMIALFWLASGLVLGESNLSTGQFLAFNAAYAIFISGVTSLSLTLTEVLDIIPLWSRSQPILSAHPEVTTDKTDPGQLTGRFCLDRVTFRYRDDGPQILTDVTVEANPGEFIALVGPSGSGKSTVLRLLLGFEQPQSGTVYFDGQDLSGLDVTALRRQLGVVLQNGHISAGSVFENISGGALISLDDAWRAAEMAGFGDDLRSFPMQMHTVVSEGGSNLSGGQRQRLIIARALALNPRLLLLDEATSALDNKTQAIVSESLDRLNLTRVVVAHRLSTIRHADRIYVIEAGRVVQVGSFDELAQQPGTFAELIQRQVA